MSITTESSLGTKEGVQDWLVSRLASRLGVDPQAIDVRERFNRHGLDSLGATRLLGELTGVLGRPLSPTLVWEYPTIEALARHLADGGRESPASASARQAAPSAAPADEPIAVVGMACRFPGAPDPGAFWRLLRDGVDAITEVPRDRWDVDALHDEDPGAPGKMSTRWGGFLDQVDGFDAPFFGISPREAIPMDPQQRLALELSWEALEDAGIGPSSLKGTPTSVFFGAMWRDYGRLPGNDRAQIAQHTATGQDLSIVPARVSYTLGLTGPSLAVNTACSSSLVAVHLARRSLLGGESRLALVGGVNLLLAPESTIAMSKFGAMAPDGRSKAFDARANGYVRGEGGGVVALKRLSDALADGDRIYCVIRGSAVNNDGFSNGLTAPSPRAQESVVREACISAGVAPAEVQYVEAHGTGTMLGDPIEAGALGAALGGGRPAAHPLRIGSVKTNIGHLEAAAGMAGLIKVALSMHHRTLPPSLHFQRPNPHIDFDALRLRVQAALTPWEGEGGRLLAGVSSFGFGGTNCHVVVEARGAEEPRLFVLSAASEDGLRARAGQLVEALVAAGEGAEGPSLEALCDEAARATHTAWRLAVVARSRAELGRHLGAFGGGQPLPGCHAGRAADRPPRVAFVFGGQGSQWQGMGRALLQEEPAARAVLEQCDRALRPYVSWSLLERLQHGDAGLFDQTDFVQPAIFAMQLALVAAWRARGVEPSAVVGQSLGEVAAACVAGALSLDDGARIICRRSQLVAGAAGKGGMAVVGLSLGATTEALSSYGGRLSVAVSSGPETTVVAGDEPTLGALLDSLQARGVFYRPVRVDYASHSAQMDPLLPALRQALAGLAPRSGVVAFYSTVLAAPLEGATLDAAYWARNLREPVLFAPTVRRLLEDGIEVFVEVDPHAVLVPALEQCLAHGGHRGIAVASAQRDEREPGTLLEASGRLLVAGVPTRVGSESTEGTEPAERAAAQLVVVSARSAVALDAQAARLRDHLDAHASQGLGDVAFSLATTRSPMEHRLAVAATSREALRAALDAAAQGQTPPGAARGRARSSRDKLAFLFTGQGAQVPDMGRGLCAAWPAFREAFDRCVRLFDRALDRPLREVMWAEAGSVEAALLDQTAYTQPALFALEYALWSLWRSWGVEPELLAGHSIGELTAACVAGVFSLEDAVLLVAARGRLMHALPAGGAMVSIAASEAEVSAAVAPHAGSVSIAAVNGPSLVVIAGDEEPVQAIAAAFAARGVRTRALRVSHAFHSPLMGPMLEAFARVAGSVTYQRPSLTLVSNLSGKVCSDEVSTPGYWVRHVREAVRFADGLKALHEAGAATFVEVGPRPTLLALVPDCLPGAEPALLASLRPGREEAASVLEALGGFWSAGGSVTWSGVFPAGGRRVPLPTYPWQRERYWLEASADGAAGDDRRAHTGGHPLLGETLTLSTQTSTHLWETTLDRGRLPWLHDHRVQGAVVLPGAAYLEMGLSAGAETFGDGPFLVTDVVLVEALAFAGDTAAVVQVVTTEEQPGHLRFQVASPAPGAGRGSFRVHARGALRRTPLPDPHARLDLAALRDRLGGPAPAATTYAALTGMGLEYGPAFQGLAELWRGEGEALGRVRLPEAAGSAAGYRLHPALLDACFQVMVGALLNSGETTPWVPVEVGSLRLLQQPSGELWCHARSLSHAPGTPERHRVDLRIVDGAGQGVAEVSGLVLQRLASGARRREEEDDWFLELAWEPAAVPATRVTAAGRWLLLGAGGGLGASVRSALEAAGHVVVHAVVHATSNAPSTAGMHALLAGAFGGQAPTAVVHLGSLDGGGELHADAVEAALVRGCDSVLATVQALAGMGYRDAPRLWLLTRGAQAVGAGEVSVAQAPLLGLGRVIAMEHAELRCGRLDLDPTHPAGEVEAVLAELLADDAEEEVALRGGARRVARLVHPLPEGERRERVEPAGGRPFRLEIDEPGVLDRLVLRAIERRSPGPGEVEIAVEAVGLNLVDVLRAQGAMPDDMPGDSGAPWALGAECVGRIVSLGEGVSGLAAGQPVIALVRGAFASHVTTPATLVLPRPAGLSAVEAAAIPIAYMSAWYALDKATRPQWERVRALFADLLDRVVAGKLAPPPAATFPISQATDAFHTMAQAPHVGKLVLTMDDPAVRIRVPTASGVTIRADGSYLVTGGLGGLGLSVAGWMAARGAGHLVLVGRSGAASPEQQAAVAALEAHGTRVTVAKADVADRVHLERVLDEVAASGMPLRGVVHAAGLLDDGLLLQQSPARFRRVMAPKVLGALHLDALTRGAPLNFFVLYASGAGLMGSPGQGNYAAANTFLDALAHHRKAQGLPALSIDWGAFSEVGLAAAQGNRGARLVSRGLRGLTPDEGMSVLERLLDGDRTQVGVVPLDVRQWVEFYPAAVSSRRLSRLVTAPPASSDRSAGDRDLLDRLAAADPNAQAALVQEFLRTQVAQVLRIPEDKLEVEVSLTSLGMDSLMGLELKNRLEAAFGVRLPATLMWEYPTLAAMAELLVDAHLRAAVAFESQSLASTPDQEVEDREEVTL